MELQEEQVIDAETAELEFERFCKSMRIRASKKEGPEFEKQKRVFIDAVCSGRLVVDEQGRAVFCPEEGDPLVFSRPKAQAFVDLGKTGKDGNEILGLVQSLCSILSVSMARINQLYEAELQILLALRALFLG
jgi:hypothetical protein